VSTRLDGLDVARFLAFTGMVVVNFRIAAEVPDAPDWSFWLADSLSGRAAALFVILAGVGLSLSRAKPGPTARRAALLMVIGLVNMTIFDADILHFYAVYFLCALPVLHWRGASLLWLAGAVIGAGLLGLLLFDYDVGWDWDALSYAGMWTPEGFLRNTFYNGWHPVVPWVAFLFVGLWLGQQPLTERRWQLGLIFGGLGLVVVTLIVSHMAASGPWADLLTRQPIPPGPVYMLGGIGGGALMIGLCLRFVPALPTGITRVFAVPGKQTLTLYIAHILIGMGILEEMGLLNGVLTGPQITGAAFAFCIAASVYALLWSRRFPRGPLEAVMARIGGR